MTFAEGIRQEIARTGYSQNRLARETGVDVSTINKLCWGKRKPTYRVLKLLSKVLPGLLFYIREEA